MGEGGVAMLFAKGLVLGLAVAAPVGPMALLCLRTTLAYGFVPGLLGGLGVAAGDAFYAGIAAFGLRAAAVLLTGQSVWLGLLGGSYLVWFGIATIRQPFPQHAAGEERRRGLRTFATTFLLTLANPPTIMTFAALFAGLGLAEARAGTGSALAVVAGVALGSAGWWLLLTFAVDRLRERLNGPLFVWVNRCSGAALTAFGLWALLRAGSSLL